MIQGNRPRPGRAAAAGLRRIIAGGAEELADLTVPAGCPLPVSDLVTFARAEPDPSRLVCYGCAYRRDVTLGAEGAPPAPDQPAFQYRFCTAPDRRGKVALVAIDVDDSHQRGANAERVQLVDERILAVVQAGVRTEAEIARRAGVSPRTVWAAIGRLRRSGQLPSSLQITRSSAA